MAEIQEREPPPFSYGRPNFEFAQPGCGGGRLAGVPGILKPLPAFCCKRLCMAIVLMALAAGFSLSAQEPVFRSSAPLVIAHTTVTDAKGDYLHALEAEDFALFADGKPVPFDLDFSFVPISLVVVAENCGDCGAAIKKVRKVGVMLLPLITGERGEAALVTYSDTARVVQRFERGGTGITEAMASIRPSGNGAALYDALAEAVSLLTPRLSGRRGVILHIGEKIDRGSQRTFEEAANLLERNNILVYSLTFSRFRTAFTDKEAWKDRTEDSEFRDKPKDGIMRTPPPTAPYGMPGPPEPHSPGAVVMGQGAAPNPGPLSGPSPMGDANLLGLFEILRDAARKNATRELTQLTGGLEESFAKQDALEKAVARIGEELHSQYLLSFHPVGKDPGRYYRIEIQVKGNPNARVRTRPGYWLAAEPE